MLSAILVAWTSGAKSHRLGSGFPGWAKGTMIGKGRQVASRIFKRAYTSFHRPVREKMTRLPGLVFLYNRVLKPLLFPPTLEDGLAKVSYPSFIMYVDPKHTPGEMALGEPWEPLTTSLFRRVIRPGDVVIDMGAHWGYFTLLAASLCENSGRVYAFEPHPKNFALLNKNIAANHLSNVVAIQKAVSDRKGETLLFESTRAAEHSLVPFWGWDADGNSTLPTISVTTVTLDGYLPSVQPRLIKMDIEGSEFHALQGMKDLVARTPELVLISELNPSYFNQNATINFLKELSTLGFDGGILDEQTGKLEFPFAEQTLERIRQHKVPRTFNVLFTRGTALTKQLHDSLIAETKRS